MIPAVVTAAILIIIAICGLYAWHVDGLPDAGRHAPRPLSLRDRQTIAFFQRLNRERRALAPLPAVPVVIATASRAPGGPWRWELPDGYRADDTQPQPFATAVWGGSPRQVADQLAALIFSNDAGRAS